MSRWLVQTLSDLCQELLGAETHWTECFQGYCKKIMGDLFINSLIAMLPILSLSHIP